LGAGWVLIIAYPSRMPTVKVGRTGISRDKAMQALREQLGVTYQVEAASHESDFLVKKGTLTGAKVRMAPGDGETEFHVHGTGLVIGRIANELTIARRVAAALTRAQLG
jgi:hypothetical protein